MGNVLLRMFWRGWYAKAYLWYFCHEYNDVLRVRLMGGVCQVDGVACVESRYLYSFVSGGCFVSMDCVLCCFVSSGSDGFCLWHCGPVDGSVI